MLYTVYHRFFEYIVEAPSPEAAKEAYAKIEAGVSAKRLKCEPATDKQRKLYAEMQSPSWPFPEATNGATA